jgi:hypothetical protein
MSDGFDLPLAMLVMSVSFRPNGMATLSGLWYYRNAKLPETEDERKGIAADLAAHVCTPVEVLGTQRQIAELLMLAVAAGTEGDPMEAIADMRSLLEQLTSSPRTDHEFDNVHNPRGTALPVDFPVRLDTDFPSLRRTLFSHPDLIHLQLQSGWSLWNGMQPPG